MHSKQPKILYIISHLIKGFAPKFLYKETSKYIARHFSSFDKEYISERVNYYCKLNTQAKLSNTCVCDSKFVYAKPSAYFLDLKPFIRHFKTENYFDYIFGDVIHIPETPSIVKSRPVCDDNQNSVVFNLDKRRHFVFINDPIAYEDKKDILVWRGYIAQNQELRQTFLNKHFHTPICNAGHINNFKNNEHKAPALSMREHLQNKFILSIEGNDVATNLKWIMSSNSLCFSTKPRYETWMMEGRLIPNYHYVLLKDDYSDLEEKTSYYLAHPEKAIEIIRNANAYIEQFKNKKREYLISLLVLNKYFSLTSR